MKKIKRIILHNFKRFRDLDLELDSEINIFIGDNECGKSTILQAIDLVARGSRSRVESIGLDRLFNVDAIDEFMEHKDMTNLPEMYIELYFDPIFDEYLEGGNNSCHINTACGIKMLCKPNSALGYSREINRILSNANSIFPLEYYTIEFNTFAGNPYNGYRRILNTIMVDNSYIGSPYSMREYIRDIYYGTLDEAKRINTKHAYHESKSNFQREVLSNYNTAISPYSFAVRESSEDNIETDLTLTQNNIPIENKGTGIQCFIKTEMSLKKTVTAVDSVLIEEPETHLSHTNMLRLIDLLKNAEERQLFISTHSDLVSTRLNLKKCVLLNSMSSTFIKLSGLTDDTAKFFMKAPDNNVLQFILSQKIILVEGDAEFILMEALYKNVTGKDLFSSGINVISVDGKCFKRYLEIANFLKIRVAVITDNDGDYVSNITNNYSAYTAKQSQNIKIFSDHDDERYTFEVCIYNDNKALLDSMIETRKRTVLKNMIANKAEIAYRLLSEQADNIKVPQYIKDAILWIDA